MDNNDQFTAILTEIAKLNVKVDGIQEQIKSVSEIDKRVVVVETEFQAFKAFMGAAKWCFGIVVTVILAVIGFFIKGGH